MKENTISLSQRKIYNYFDREPELKVLLIFNDPFLKEELSVAEWREGYRYVVFQGDWFTCKYLLDTEWADDKTILYFDMPSPLEDKKVRENFPLMDVLVANTVYHHEDYAAFMQQYRIPASMTTFVEKNVMLLQTDKMITLLQSYYHDGTINEDIAARGFLSMYLGQQRVLEWDDILIRVLLQGRTSERNKQVDFYKKLQGNKMMFEVLNKRFTDIFGVGIEYHTETKVEKIVTAFKYNAIVQSLAVVENDNYKQHRINNSIALQQLNRMLELVMSQPKSAKAFEELLDELGTSIRCEEIVKWYGAQVNYHFIPEELCMLILRDLLVNNNIADNSETVMNRVAYLLSKREESGLWKGIMDYVVCVAGYYEKVAAIASLTLKTPNDYIRFYEEEFFRIDQLYRQAIELYYQLNPSHQLFAEMQQVKMAMDLHYAKIANRVNLEWTKCLQETGGFGSLQQTRQWDFYETLIKPIQKKVAVIVCDALRYEMAKQLIGELAKSKHMAKIYAGIATLPTETKFCKPSLLPHNALKLYGTESEQNMSVDDKILSDLEKRSAHLQSYKEGAVCVPFETLKKYSLDVKRELFKRPLVYVFHNDIDEAGHTNSAEKIVNGCSKAIKDLSDIIVNMLASCNVTEVYITSDHGFLFNDMDFEEKDKHKVTEDSLEQKSRYYLTNSDASVEGMVKFNLNEVSGMENTEGVKVAVPLGTNRLAAPSGGYMFAHGGASLQEIIIPIIVSRQERKDEKEPVEVMVLNNKRLSIQASRIRFTLLQTDAVDMNTKERTVTAALYHNDVPVTPVKEITLDKTDPLLDNRKILVDLTLNKNVSAKVLQLKIFDKNDENNPLIKENVTNNTLIENDFDF